jgi:NADH-quinone oxidoreductase subunit J
MTYETVMFYMLSAAAVSAAVVATYARSIVSSAFGLLFSLLSVAGLYVLLRADFVAVTQVVVYVGGIVVLMLFGVLLTNRRLEDLASFAHRPRWLALVLGAAMLSVLVGIIWSGSWHTSQIKPLEGTTRPLGYLLLQDYLLPFEFSSLTLLIALVGAAYLVRSRERDE